MITQQTQLSSNDSSTVRPRCRPKPLYNGNPEALGWALDVIARIIGFIAPAVYLSVAIINLAKLEAGCDISEDAPECNVRVHGLRPSSLITTFATVVGVTSACCLPFLGAVIDYTPYRRILGSVTAIAQIGFTFGQVFVTESNWFALFIAQIFNAFFGWIHTLVVFAYLPELTDDAKLLVTWTANFHILQYVTLLLFMAYMLGILKVMGFDGENDYLISSRVASISASVMIIPLYLWTWTSLMKQREAYHQLPEGSSLWTIGFIKVFRTLKKLQNRNRAVMWFFVNVALSEAAKASIASISLTYFTDTLHMTTYQTAIMFSLLFIFGIIGAIISQKSVSLIDPIRSNQICLVFTAACTAMAAVILYKPGQQIRAYIVAALWGIGAGWKNTVETYTVCQIIPKKQDAELMGFYLFSGQVIVWLPTLIFTAMNEAGISQRIGLSILIVFYSGGMASLCMMGSYDDAVSLAQEDSDMNDSSGLNENPEDVGRR